VEARNRFNIRVYGLLIHPEAKVLVSDELIHNQSITKFPGGGLQWGEGLIDGLQREFNEEIKINISVAQHLYTTDVFQASAYNPQDQIISIYYQVTTTEWDTISVVTKAHDYDYNLDPPQCVRWIAIDRIHEILFSFPIDKIIVQKICNKEISLIL